MAQRIQHNVFFPQQPEAVWEYLTQPDLIAKWLMPNNFQPKVGHKFQFRMKPLPQLNLDGIFQCEVLEIDPLKSLSYSWNFGPGDGVTQYESVVHWTLKEVPGGTELQLIHNAFEETSAVQVFNLFNDGWFQNIQKILRLVTETANGTAKA